MKSQNSKVLYEEIAKLNSTIMLLESRVLKYRAALEKIKYSQEALPLIGITTITRIAAEAIRYD